MIAVFITFFTHGMSKGNFLIKLQEFFFLWNNKISIEECTKNGCPSRWWKQHHYREYRREMRNNYRRKLKKLGHAHQWNFPFNANFCQRTTFSSLWMCLNEAFVASGSAFISKAIHCNGEYFPLYSIGYVGWSYLWQFILKNQLHNYIWFNCT